MLMRRIYELHLDHPFVQKPMTTVNAGVLAYDLSKSQAQDHINGQVLTGHMDFNETRVSNFSASSFRSL